MITPLQNIHFTILYFDESIAVSCHSGEFRNLMVLINEKIYVEDFGECKGIGRCGTCLVEITSKNVLAPMERNEASTLKKCAVQREGLRLSCQVMIDEALQNTVITIVEEREDVR
ncbi:MAG: 2Fe-2S iron-sulfur cluster-binding protein [Ginsengibacter sp.]